MLNNREDLDRTLQVIANAPTDSFTELVKLSGLNPKEDFRGEDLSRTSLSELDLRGYNFTGTNLSHANLSGANLENVILDRANLEEAILDGASLRYASLKYTNLRNASCREVDLEGVDLTSAVTNGAVIVPRASSSHSMRVRETLSGPIQENPQRSRFNRDPREILISWLNDAYAMEKGFIQVLENHADDFRSVNEVYYVKYTKHLEQTRLHAERVRECVERLGDSISHMKAAMGAISGFFQGRSTGAAPDELVKNILSDYAAERFQIASYRALIAAARALGEIEVVRICEAILREEEDMAHWFENVIPSAVESYIGQTVRSRAPAY